MTANDIKTKFIALWQQTRLLLSAAVSFVLPIIKKSQNYFLEHKQTLFKLSIPAVIIAVGLYSCSAEKKKIRLNMEDIFTISEEIRGAYVGYPDYWGLSNSNIIKQNILSSRFVKNGKIILSGGEEVFIGRGAEALPLMPRETSFDIVMRGLTKAQCITYTEYPLSEEHLIMIERISIVNASGQTDFDWSGLHTLPIKTYESKDFCADKNNTVFWSIK